jgi:hypothetical protein
VEHVARGWESKSVEDQVAEAQAKAKDNSNKPNLTPEELQKQQRRRGLELALLKTNADLAASTNDRHRQMLEAAKAELEKRLAAL